MLTAIALGSSGFLAPAQFASAADVTIDDVHAPSDNMYAPGGGPPVGTAAGYIGGESDSGNVTGNTLTYNGRSIPYDKFLFGGVTFGTGSVTGNRVTVNATALPLTSSVNGIYGGGTSGGGSILNNHAEFNGDHLNGDMAGGAANHTGTGKVEGNTATLKGGSAHGDIYGGMAVGGANGDVVGNTATIEGGTATDIGKAVYGGYTDGTGAVTGNKVVITGGTANDLYGGRAQSGDATGNTVTITRGTVRNIIGGRAESGNATGNTVNLGDGKSDYAGLVNGVIYGGSGTTYGKDYRAGNTLNVYDNAGAANIRNFEKLNFHFNQYVNKAAAMLTLQNAGGTTIESLGDLAVDGEHARKGTLIRATNDITITDGQSRLVRTQDNKELILEKSADNKNINYEGYQFKNATQAATITESGVTSTWGGRSVVGNTTAENEITISDGAHTNVYGGWTSGTGSTADASKQKDSTKNKVTVRGTAAVSGTVYGGYTDAAGGKATGNEVTIERSIAGGVVGGKALGDASGNTVHVTGAAVSSVTGGDGGTTNNNTVNLSGAAVTGAVAGGTQASSTGNTLNISAASSAQRIENFQTVAFKNTSAKLTLTQAGAAFDLNAVQADYAATENEETLVENAGGLTLKDGKTFRTMLSTDRTKETNIAARSGNTRIVRYGYTFKGATAPTAASTEIWGGRSAAGNTTTGNTITVNDSSSKTVYGGWTSGTGTSAAGADAGDSRANTVNITGGSYTAVYGGRTDTAGGSASDNTVNITGSVTGSITGGYGAATNNNIINLRGATVHGTVRGGTAAGGTGNTLAVYRPSAVQDFSGVQNLHLYTDEITAGSQAPLLRLGAHTKDIRGLHIGVNRSGAAPKLNKGDKILLLKTSGGALTTDTAIQNSIEGMQGVSRRYTFDIAQTATGELTATVTKAGFAAQAKSLVETRTGASAFLNDGGDLIAQTGLTAAKAAAAPAGGAYGLWAGMGGGALRHNTGSYVEMKGWNLGVGWARESSLQAGKLTYGPFIEYGRGSYDSYLDDGTHGDGASSYLGAGIMAEIALHSGIRVDGALRVGRAKSDYSGSIGGTSTHYDSANNYYGIQLGAAQDFAVRRDSVVSAYLRCFYTHAAGARATLSSGETYDFDAVRSQRVRVGARWTHTAAAGQVYAGLGYEHEFDGAARASYDGENAPSPSLGGGSGLLELGYRFAPQGSRAAYDLHLTGWQGKREGVTGGISARWAF